MTTRDPARNPPLKRPDAATCTYLLLLVAVIVACSNAKIDGGAPGVMAVSPNVTTDPDIRQILVASCFDCHSNHEASALGARMAPSYLFAVGKARQALNFSRWSAYPMQKRRAELMGIAKAVEDGSMPPGDYGFFHPSASLSAGQRRKLLEWASSARASAN